MEGRAALATEDNLAVQTLLAVFLRITTLQNKAKVRLRKNARVAPGSLPRLPLLNSCWSKHPSSDKRKENLQSRWPDCPVVAHSNVSTTDIILDPKK